MRRNFPYVPALMLFLVVSAAYGDEAGRTAKAEELIRVAKLEDTFRQAMNVVMNQAQSGLLQQIAGVQLSPEQKKVRAEFEEKLKVIMNDAVGWDKLKPDYVKLYASVYTEQELDDLLAFYKSPTGQATISKTPSLMSRASEMAQQRLAASAPQMQKLIKELKSRIAPPGQGLPKP